MVYGIPAAIAVFLFHFGMIDKMEFNSFLYAALLNFANSLIAISAFSFSASKSDKSFIFFNLGGMVVRLFALLFLIFVIIKFLIIDVYEFILVFFVFYFIQLGVEIFHFANYREINRENGN